MNPYQISRGQEFIDFLHQRIHIEGVHIARMDLAFDNKKIVDLLEERGLAISQQDYKKIQKIEIKIEKLKEELYHGKIVGAFVTYNNQQDIKHVARLFGDNMIDNKDLKVFKPDEPQNICWKNLAIT